MSASNNNTNYPNYIEPKDHNHVMVYYGFNNNGCEIHHFYICQDRKCGHWEDRFEYDHSKCDMQVTRFSTRVTCYECSKCGRKDQDRS